MAKKGENGSSTALDRMMKQAEAMDSRRQRQIRQQAVRIDSMKELVHSLAEEIRELEKKVVDELGPAPRSVNQIINEAVSRSNPVETEE